MAPSLRLANFRIVSSGPESESGGSTALMRLPSARRASTIGVDSSTRRPAWATIFTMIRRRCESSLNLTSVWKILPWRSIQTSYGPLTMISVIVSSASRRSSGPWPRMSSVSSRTRRSRSLRAMPASASSSCVTS